MFIVMIRQPNSIGLTRYLEPNSFRDRKREKKNQKINTEFINKGEIMNTYFFSEDYDFLSENKLYWAIHFHFIAKKKVLIHIVAGRYCVIVRVYLKL